jgi:hypothetical protein
MRRFLTILLLLLVFFVLSGFIGTGFHHSLKIGMGGGFGGTPTEHRLFIDGTSGNYLLIDGANHYLRIDGV